MEFLIKVYEFLLKVIIYNWGLLIVVFVLFLIFLATMYMTMNQQFREEEIEERINSNYKSRDKK